MLSHALRRLQLNKIFQFKCGESSGVAITVHLGQKIVKVRF